MRAFGLITGDVDLFAAISEFSGAGTLAYYSFEDERITIRGQTGPRQSAQRWSTS